jgi:hypothetical protein
VDKRDDRGSHDIERTSRETVSPSYFVDWCVELIVLQQAVIWRHIIRHCNSVAVEILIYTGSNTILPRRPSWVSYIVGILFIGLDKG